MFSFDFVGMDSAENEEVIILGKEMHRPDNNLETFVFAEEAEDADQFGALWQTG